MGRKTEYAWGDVDWNDSDTNIAKSLGSSVPTVWAARRRYGFPVQLLSGVGGNKGLREKLAEADWSKTDVELGRAHGGSPAGIRYWRRRLGAPDSPMAKIASRTDIDLETWDWSKDDVLLAEEYGISKSSVAAYRRKLGKQKPTIFNPRHTFSGKGRRSQIDFSKVVFGRPDAVIAKELGVSCALVKSRRTEMGIPRGLRRKYDMSAADWTQHDADIAKSIGASPHAVRLERQRLGHPKVLRLDSTDYSGIDWANKTNFEIGTALGVDHSTVSRARLRLGAPKSPGKPRKHPKRNVRRAGPTDLEKSRFDNVDWSLNNRQIAEELGLSATLVCIARRSFGAQRSPGRKVPKPSQIDWSLSNVEIAKGIGCSPSVVRYWRLTEQRKTKQLQKL